MKVELRNNVDFLAGLLMLAIGGGAFYMALDFPFGSSLRMGPGYFPRVLAGIFMTFGLFVLTAIAEIVGCYLPYVWLRKNSSPWLLVPGAASLALFAWLLTLHPTASGRVYAAYGGVYIAVALVWLWLVEGERPTAWDIAGALVAMTGMAIIVLGPRR